MSRLGVLLFSLLIVDGWARAEAPSSKAPEAVPNKLDLGTCRAQDSKSSCQPQNVNPNEPKSKAHKMRRKIKKK